MTDTADTTAREAAIDAARAIQQGADEWLVAQLAEAIEAAYARGYADAASGAGADLADAERLILRASRLCEALAEQHEAGEDFDEPFVAARYRAVYQALVALADVLRGRDPEGAIVVMAGAL